MAFCSPQNSSKLFHGGISRQSCSGLLLKVFEKGPQWSWAYLWGTFLLPWGLFSLPVRTGVLVPEPSSNPPEKGAGDTRGLLLSGISSSLKSPLLPAPAERFLAFAEKTKRNKTKVVLIQKRVPRLVTPYNFTHRLRKIDISFPVGGAIFTGSLWSRA